MDFTVTNIYEWDAPDFNREHGCDPPVTIESRRLSVSERNRFMRLDIGTSRFSEWEGLAKLACRRISNFLVNGAKVDTIEKLLECSHPAATQLFTQYVTHVVSNNEVGQDFLADSG